MVNKLMQFICPKCQTPLIWAQPQATVYCKQCNRWVSAEQLKDSKLITMNGDNGQIILIDE